MSMSGWRYIASRFNTVPTPLTNCQVGVGGSGRKSLATLAAFVAEQERIARVDTAGGLGKQSVIV